MLRECSLLSTVPSHSVTFFFPSPRRRDAGASHNPVAGCLAAFLPLFPTRQDAGASHNPVAGRFSAFLLLFPRRRDAGASHSPVAGRFSASLPLFPTRQDAGASHNPVACVFAVFLLLFPPGPSPAHRPPMALRVTFDGEGQDHFGIPSPNHLATFPKRTRTFPTESSSGATRSHFSRGRSATLLGKVSISSGGPSPSLRPPTALCVTFGGEGHSTFLRPSPNHIDTFPKRTRTFPTESSSGATRSHFSRGRSATFLGKVSFSSGGPSPAHRPPTALCAISSGEGHGTFLRPSPNHIDTFPKRTRTFPTESSSGA